MESSRSLLKSRRLRAEWGAQLRSMMCRHARGDGKYDVPSRPFCLSTLSDSDLTRVYMKMGTAIPHRREFHTYLGPVWPRTWKSSLYLAHFSMAGFFFAPNHEGKPPAIAWPTLDTEGEKEQQQAGQVFRETPLQKTKISAH